jgi:hypothetical protein
MDDPWPAIALIQQFVARVQSAPMPQRPDATEWVAIHSTAQLSEEHARWIGSLEIEEWLGVDAHRTQLDVQKLNADDREGYVKQILGVPERFIAVTGVGQQFEYLVDRSFVLEQVAKRIATAP